MEALGLSPMPANQDSIPNQRAVSAPPGDGILNQSV